MFRPGSIAAVSGPCVFLWLCAFLGLAALLLSPAAAQDYRGHPAAGYHPVPPPGAHMPGAAWQPARSRRMREAVVWRPHRIIVEFRAEPRRRLARRPASAAARFPVHARPVHARPVRYHYHPAPYPSPRLVHAGGGGACLRIANPVSRRACQCAVAHGGTVRELPHRRIGWSDPRGGAASLALQNCKAGY